MMMKKNDEEEFKAWLEYIDCLDLYNNLDEEGQIEYRDAVIETIDYHRFHLTREIQRFKTELFNKIDELLKK